MALTLSSLALFSLTLTCCLALEEQVLSAFVFTQHGDRTPLYAPDLSILTPYGAQQMYTAGSRLRNRYLTTTFNEAGDSTAIQDISHYQLNADEILILTNDDQFNIASAQAFMQGLYPPLADASNLNYTQMAGISDLANGTNIVAPLNGYQYAPITTASNYDLNSIWVDGAADCPEWTERLVEYYNTSDFDFLYTSTMDFYQGLEGDFLSNNFAPNNLGELSYGTTNVSEDMNFQKHGVAVTSASKFPCANMCVQDISTATTSGITSNMHIFIMRTSQP